MSVAWIVILAFATPVLALDIPSFQREFAQAPRALVGPRPAAPDSARTDVHESWLDVGGSTIRALCTGGRKQVVLLHDEDSSADAWIPILRRLDGRVGACAYDRTGSGQSTDAPRERGWYELLDEFRRVHVALGVDDGYVLVGHGLGGLYARVYAMDRPRDASGLILVDPSHEDMPRRVRAGMPRAEWAAWMDTRTRPNSDGVIEARVADRARASRLADVRVTVITAAVRSEGEGWDPRFVNEAARRVHADIARGIEMGRHVPASRSTHDIPGDEPQLVADEILRMVRALDGQRSRAP
jgi:pimeloyl-ACP methyl ester carboxylesterase